MGLLFNIILYPIIYIFPAYAANGAPVLFKGWGPLDLGKKFKGKRVFGDHKTVRGTASALIAGVAAGIMESLVFHMPYLLPISILLALGTICGDLIGSFMKRRMGMKSGESLIAMDQFGFVVFALLFAVWLGHLPALFGFVTIIVLTGILHPLTNRGANKLSLKKVPW